MQTIVITSIFPPTLAVERFAKLEGYNLIVVGDRKTPEDWSHAGVRFFSYAQQLTSSWELAKSLPQDHYSRKMLGYLEGIKHGSEVIIDTDDDNIPYDKWTFPSFDGEYESIEGCRGFVNVYQLFTDQPIWPRGLPLAMIKTDFRLQNYIGSKQCRVGIWQGLADDDPDVDAIYRLTSDAPCRFSSRAPVVLGSGTICPFNSQNTAFRTELFPLLYLPTAVTFRFTDILRGLVAQPIMALYGYSLGFTQATVRQERNPHDYMKDFESELPMYRYCETVVSIVSSAVSPLESVQTNLINAYTALTKASVTTGAEMVTLKAWLSDIQRAELVGRTDHDN
jgi:hypothetical protein